MARVGTIVEIRGGQAVINTARRGVCDGCSQQGSCSFDHALGKGKPETVLAENPIGARPGQRVEFDLAGHAELKASLLVWFFPLAGLLAGALLGNHFHQAVSMSADGAAAIGAFAGLAIFMAGLMAYDRLFAARDKNLVPRVIRIVKHPCLEKNSED